MRVTESNTDLGRGKALTGELHDLLSDFFGCRLEPWRGGTAIRKSRGRCVSYLEFATKHLQINVQMPLPGACMRPMLTLCDDEHLPYARNSYSRLLVIRLAWGERLSSTFSIWPSGFCRAVAELTIQHQTLFFPLFVHVAEASPADILSFNA